MNMTDVISDIKWTNGLQTIALPFDKPIEVVVQEILKTSIRTFSRFKPWEREEFVERKDLPYSSELERRRCIYILPPSLTTTHVSWADAELASNQYQDEEANLNTFTVGTPFVGFGAYYPQDIVNATMTGASINKFASITSNQPNSKWLGFNKIQLFNFPDTCMLRIVAKCEHDMNGETIPESCVQSFMQLANLDVQRSLYNMLKNMNNVGSAFKEIQLKIDDWSGAEQSRNELVKSWEENFHLDQLDLVQFF
jgi:hypothetical protein